MTQTIYFGGPSAPEPSDHKREDLDAISKFEFRALFAEWVQQIWMQESVVPNDEQSLKDFSLAELIALFRKRYNQGDWRRIVPGRGTTVEWFVLWLQLITGRPQAIVLSTKWPLPPAGRIKRKLLLDSWEIGACLINYLKNIPKHPKHVTNREQSDLLGFQEREREGAPVMLYDGKLGHVIQARTIDDSLKWLGYDDFSWREGSSMLCEGENDFGIDAKYYGQPEIGEWVTSTISVSFVIYGIPMRADQIPFFEQWAEAARRESEQSSKQH